MPWFIISWDAQTFTDRDIVSAESIEAATMIAKQNWEISQEMLEPYYAEPFSQERANELGVDYDDSIT